MFMGIVQVAAALVSLLWSHVLLGRHLRLGIWSRYSPPEKRRARSFFVFLFCLCFFLGTLCCATAAVSGRRWSRDRGEGLRDVGDRMRMASASCQCFVLDSLLRSALIAKTSCESITTADNGRTPPRLGEAGPSTDVLMLLGYMMRTSRKIQVTKYPTQLPPFRNEGLPSQAHTRCRTWVGEKEGKRKKVKRTGRQARSKNE